MCTSPYLGAISEPSCLIFLAPGLAQRHRPLPSRQLLDARTQIRMLAWEEMLMNAFFLSRYKLPLPSLTTSYNSTLTQTNLLDHPYGWSLVSFRIETQYSIGSKMGLAGGELSALMPADLWHHVLFNFSSWECCRDNHNHEQYTHKH